MDNEFICNSLKKWITLFYGTDKKQYIVSYKKGDYFYFGYENGDDFIINKVSIPVAIFLALGNVSFLKFLEKEKSSKNKVQPIRRRRNE
jgi:hypothetical protein